MELDLNDSPRAQNTPPPGLRPGVLQDPGPRWDEAVTVCYVAAAPPSLVVSLVAEHDHVDQATVQFLLQQSLLAHAEEEEKARTAWRTRRCSGWQSWSMRSRGVMGIASRSTTRLSSVRPAPSSLTPRLSGRRRRRGRRGGETGTGLGSWSAAPHDVSSILSDVVRSSVLGVARGVLWISGRRLLVYSRVQLGLVRQWTHVWRFLVCFFGPLYLAVTCSVLVLPEEHWCVDYSERYFRMVPYSALSGSTVDTYFCQSTEAWLFSRTPA